MFVPDAPDGLGSDGLSIARPQEVCLVLFLHGSEAEQEPDHCVPAVSPAGTVPPVIGALAEEVVASRRILVFAPCTKVTPGYRHSREEYKVHQRAQELTSLLDQLEKVGYSRDAIFVAGHSAGAWIALTTLARNPKSFAGVIGFAPAFAGQRSGQDESNPFWVEERVAQSQLLKNTPLLPSLIYAFERDEFESQGALRTIFKRIPGVTFVEVAEKKTRMYDGATAGRMFHNGAYHHSTLKQKRRILEFLETALASQPPNQSLPGAS